MFKTRSDANERRWSELIEEIDHHLAIIKDDEDNRVRTVWGLKMIAESIAELDTIDRLDGYLPLQVRPALALTPYEAALVLHKLKADNEHNSGALNKKTATLVERLESYLDRRMNEYLR